MVLDLDLAATLGLAVPTIQKLLKHPQLVRNYDYVELTPEERSANNLPDGYYSFGLTLSGLHCMRGFTASSQFGQVVRDLETVLRIKHGGGNEAT